MEKVLIANRGEIALRILEACREEGLKAVAVYSEPERGALHVRLAHEAVCIGSGPARKSYLNIPAVLAACEVTDCDAVHPGYGFLSENPDFAEACEDMGITFVGPPSRVLRLCGDKSATRERVAENGVPILPGTGPIADEEELVRAAEQIGYPLLVKAVSGGGGRGIRLVSSPEELLPTFRQAQREAKAATGDPRVYLEAYVPSPRHVEVQVLADTRGHIVHWGTRDCTVQRRHQKVVEEAPAPELSEEMRRALGEAAIRAAEAVGLVGAGTVEFLVAGDRFYFIEINPRIQVEHPVSEVRVGRNLVREQLRIAKGEPLGYSQEQIEFWGWAMECRINAEDPRHDFLPSTGTVHIESLPGGMGVRLDTHLYQGMEVLPYYDSLLAKLITFGEDREEARLRMYSALKRFKISGVKTNVELLLEVISHPDFARVIHTTDLLELILPPK
ncbi:acetyl-CoA carboxylase biotin carboxylase subunit [Candidatus Bipolaricaulota sp. J31]